MRMLKTLWRLAVSKDRASGALRNSGPRQRPPSETATHQDYAARLIKDEPPTRTPQ
jgi:hypothetical protein